MKDYSEWLTPARLAEEERLWADPDKATWPFFVRAIESLNPHLPGVPPRIICELGCGTGWVAAALPPFIRYYGVDANPLCLDLARAKNGGLDNPDRKFILADIRHFMPTTLERTDLVCAFSVMKHFALSEWARVLGGMLAIGRVGLFSMPVGPVTVDDGVDFPHLQVTPKILEDAVHDAGHRVVAVERLPWGEVMVTTCR